MKSPFDARFDFLHVCAGCWASGGGLSEVVAHLLLAQAQLGLHVGLVYLDDHPPHPLLKRCRALGVALFPLRRRLRDPFFFSWAMLRQLPTLVLQSKHLIIHGAWTFPVYWAARCARKAQIPYTLIPHGALNPLMRRHGRLRKQLLWTLCDGRTYRHAERIHAASDWEAQWIRDALRPHTCPPLIETPLGVDGDCLDAVPAQPRTKTFLYLGRNHPLKGIDLLLRAWEKAALGDEWQLHLAGADTFPAPLPPNVHTLGPLHGEAKARALKSAACLILPTRSESFGLVIAEALWCQTPVICTQGAPWRELGDFWVETTVDALADALKRFVALTPEARTQHFAPLFASARERFHWTTIARRLSER